MLALNSCNSNFNSSLTRATSVKTLTIYARVSNQKANLQSHHYTVRLPDPTLPFLLLVSSDIFTPQILPTNSFSELLSFLRSSFCFNTAIDKLGQLFGLKCFMKP